MCVFSSCKALSVSTKVATHYALQLLRHRTDFAGTILRPPSSCVAPIAVCTPPAVSPKCMVVVYAGVTPTLVCSAVHSGFPLLLFMTVARKRKALSGLAPVPKIPFGVAVAEQIHSWATVNASVDDGDLLLLGVRESLVPVTV